MTHPEKKIPLLAEAAVVEIKMLAPEVILKLNPFEKSQGIYVHFMNQIIPKH